VTTFVLVHGAWHGDWAWERVVPLLESTGARVVAPNLTVESDVGLSDHVNEVVAVLDALPADGRTVIVGHSYGGLVVRQAADVRADRVAHVVLVDGWAGGDGASLFSLAPEWFVDGIRKATAAKNGWSIPAPHPAVFGIAEPDDIQWLDARLRSHPVRTFEEATRLSGAIEAISGTGLYCSPSNLPFAQFAAELGYRVVALDGPHDVMLTDPESLARELLAAAER
jgi:pimeloyl-ACP methyl ester carboxylesterase